MRRPFIWGPPAEWKINVAYILGKQQQKDAVAANAVKHKDAGADDKTDALWHVFDIVCSFALLEQRGDVSDNEACGLLEASWKDLPFDDKLMLSPYKIHVKSGPTFNPGFCCDLYIGNEEDTTPDSSILLATRLDIKTMTTELWGWMTAEDLRRKRRPTRMRNYRNGEYVLGVPYLETEPPETLDLLRPLNRRRRAA